MASQGAARCSDCGLNWPRGLTRCGVCLGDLDAFTYAAPMSVDEAKVLSARAEFEREYAKRERGHHSRCGRPRQGPSPEEVGALEARAMAPGIKEIQALEKTWRS